MKYMMVDLLGATLFVAMFIFLGWLSEKVAAVTNPVLMMSIGTVVAVFIGTVLVLVWQKRRY